MKPVSTYQSASVRYEIDGSFSEMTYLKATVVSISGGVIEHRS